MNANTITPDDVGALADRVREHAARVMSPQKANELADALASCQGMKPAKTSGGHRLAEDAAAKLFASGKLRQAEKAYAELVAKHGDISAYIGLARTQATLEDNDAALTTLRDGAARFARANDRASAVSLLAEAVALVPADLAAHRRLAAALANQGDLPGAVEEYARFVDVSLSTHDTRRALLEIEYGRETLGDVPGLVALVDRVTGGQPASRVDAPRPPSRPALRQAVVDAPRPAQPVRLVPPAQVAPPQPAPPPKPAATPLTQRVSGIAPARVMPKAPARPSTSTGGSLVARTRGASSETAVVTKGATTLTHSEPDTAGNAIDVLMRAGVVRRKQERPPVDIEQQLAALMSGGSGIEAATNAASRAALLTGAHDPRATDAALDAARRLLALGKLQSASDVLLDFIGHGFTDREAQRLLIEIDCALGRRDVAKEKCSLLAQAYRLDGRTDVAEDVDRLAKMI